MMCCGVLSLGKAFYVFFCYRVNFVGVIMMCCGVLSSGKAFYVFFVFFGKICWGVLYLGKSF